MDTAVIKNTWYLVYELNPYEPPRPERIFKSLNLLEPSSLKMNFFRLSKEYLVRVVVVSNMKTYFGAT